MPVPNITQHGHRRDDDDDDEVYYYICERPKLEEETENMGVCTKERKDIFLPIV